MAKRAALVVAAQADSAASRGNPDGSVDPQQSPRLEKEGAADPTVKLDGAGKPGQRGDGQFNDGDNS
jgi:hypothetical protein